MALIVGIVLAYLSRVGARRAARWVWGGVGTAAAVSFAFLGVLNGLEAELKGATALIYEGAAMLLAAGFLTWMIFWMLERARYLRRELEGGVEEALARGAAWGLFMLAFFTVAREGVETALLLFAAPGEGKLLGTVVGFAVAGTIGVLVYVFGRRIDLRAFFRVTGVLLVLFAAGLVTHGVHELVEAGLPGGPVIFDFRDVLPDSTGAGAILRALFGYSADPTLLEAVVYVAYFALVWAIGYLRPARVTVAPRTT
ncbi:MAG: hypothetical protein AUJ06_00195 [Chloroflexi bacterium 13_1_40CM_3_70_6]|nr:MAG: hypothetical protein AUJ06_00195 [Chloroflexi bacterium 13_1_40CM_3_70_6]